jgi:hypothetical protein
MDTLDQLGTLDHKARMVQPGTLVQQARMVLTGTLDHKA